MQQQNKGEAEGTQNIAASATLSPLAILKSSYMNKAIFFRAIIFLTILYLISYFFAIAKSDGADGIFVTIMSLPAIVLSFPFLWAAVHLFETHLDFWVLLMVGGLDILLYAVFIERILYYLKTKSVLYWVRKRIK